MSRGFFIRAILVVGLAWFAMSAVRAVSGESTEPAESAPAVKIKVDPLGGGNSYEAQALFTSITLETTFGKLEIQISKLQSIVVERVDNDHVHIVAEMLDHNRFTGRLLNPEFKVRNKGEEQTLAPKSLEKIKFLHPKSSGLLAALIGLLTLSLMEIVLGIDNVIFLAIVAGKLPAEQQPRARRIGLIAALASRLLLLASLSFLLELTKPLFYLPELAFLSDLEARGISWRDLILLLGGMFLIGKSTFEMREKLERAADHAAGKPVKKATFGVVIVQIAIIDIIFSLDSVITAVGMVEELWVMIVAMILAVLVMVAFAETISRFVDRNPTIKILALSFLILIGVLLVAEGLGQHMNKGYIYFAMAFAVVIELLNMKLRKASPVHTS